MDIKQQPSPYFNDRNGARPTFLVLHYTATATGQEVVDDYFCHPHPPNGEVSAHYMVDRDGSVTQFVDEEKRAYHAGLSHWNGMDDLNTHSIGIEIVNPGHDYGYIPFTDAQMASVKVLCKDILARHDIPAYHVLAHSDIAPDRKIDPGELFDWEGLAADGIGVWPVSLLKEDFDKATALLADDSALKQALVDYGYDDGHDLGVLVTQFQRHFQPSVFQDSTKVGRADQDTVARLCCLLRLRNTPKA